MPSLTTPPHSSSSISPLENIHHNQASGSAHKNHPSNDSSGSYFTQSHYSTSHPHPHPLSNGSSKFAKRIHQPSSSTSVTQSNERRDPLKSLIKPFLRRGHSNPIESIKGTLALGLGLNKTNSPLNSASTEETSASGSGGGGSSGGIAPAGPVPQAKKPEQPPKSKRISSFDLLQEQPHKSSNRRLGRNRTESNKLIVHQPSSNELVPQDLIVKPPSPSSPQDVPAFFASPQLITSHHQPPLSGPSQAHFSENHSQPTLSPSASYFDAECLKKTPHSVSLISSIHSILTQPALVTLAQLAPAQLLSGVRPSRFGPLESLRVFDEYEALSDREAQGHYNLPRTNGTTRNQDEGSNASSQARKLSTSIEQLSSSSVALPITSISGIWRLLNCIEWLNFKERELISSTVTQSRLNSYSSNYPTAEPINKRTEDPFIRSFDLANTLQHVGDILSAISSDSELEIVFYHMFYPPALEQTELSMLHSQPNEANSAPVEEVLAHPALTPGASSDSSIRERILGQNSEHSNTFLGAGADGEGGLREISVRADEQGLIIGLTCLLRQIIFKAKRSSTIEVGLHLTPLYKSEGEISEATGKFGSMNETRSPESKADTASGDQKKTPSSWKCIFDVSLTPPPPIKPDSSNSDGKAVASSDPVQNPGDCSRPENDSVSGLTIDKRASDPLARLRMSNNLTSELPLCPEESLSKIIFQRLLGMKLSTGRKTPGGHSWQATGVFEIGVDRESEELPAVDLLKKNSTGQSKGSGSTVPEPSREPTADELTLFAENVLRGKKAVFFAAEQSIFAKHITTYLTSWNMDVSHMPYATGTGSENGILKNTGTSESFPPPQKINPESSGSLSFQNPNLAPSSLALPDSTATLKSTRTKSFLIIDDDIKTLKAEVLKLKNSPPASIHFPTNLLQSKPQQQPPQRPTLSRRTKSSTQIDPFEGSSRKANISILYFTSISNFCKVQDVIRTQLTGTQWSFIPDILVIPKPIGPRRILTALHTAINRPLIDPHFVPIATSPSSPGTSYHIGSSHHSIGASPLGRTSPALTHLGGNEFDFASSNQMKNDHPHGDTPPGELPAPSLPGSTPPGLRTPGTAPGTPGFPSPALLSNEALEYFSKAASENGGSSSTGVVLQSPDGRPQAMFFHHNVSSHRSSSSQAITLSNAHHHLAQSTSSVGGPLGRNGSSRSKHENRNSLSKPMIRECIGVETSAEPKSLAQQVMSGATGDLLKLGSQKPLLSSESLTDSPENSQPNSNQNSRRTSSVAPANNDYPLSHAMDLDKFEAVSPQTPTMAISPDVLSNNEFQRQNPTPSPISTPTQASLVTTPGSSDPASGHLSQLTREQQMMLLNPRPVPMLRMPSVPASLPTSISATLPSARRPPMSSSLSTVTASLSKSRPQNSPPIQSLQSVTPGEGMTKSDNLLNQSNLSMSTANPSRSRSTSMQANRRRTSMGDSIAGNRLGRRKSTRKPTTTLVPPINVLIVEDNKINQTILATFLRKKSVKFDVAENGQEAVDKWRSGSFHLVLMDLQLPVKDGMQATKEIREAERAVNINAFANTPPAAAGGNSPPTLLSQTYSRRTPHNVSVIIVALTASSSSEDREVALAAGCNDFLTKPVSLAWLEKKLLEWGSMAWLSGFSCMTMPPHTLNRSLPVSTSAQTNLIRSAETIMSFTSSTAQRKARDVAEHLHIKPDKNSACQDGQTDSGSASVSISESVNNSLSETQTPAMSERGNNEAQQVPTVVKEGSGGLQNGRISSQDYEEESEEFGNKTRNSDNRPSISLQAPTPERSGNFKSMYDSSNLIKIDEAISKDLSLAERKTSVKMNDPPTLTTSTLSSSVTLPSSLASTSLIEELAEEKSENMENEENSIESIVDHRNDNDGDVDDERKREEEK